MNLCMSPLKVMLSKQSRLIIFKLEPRSLNFDLVKILNILFASLEIIFLKNSSFLFFRKETTASTLLRI